MQQISGAVGFTGGWARLRTTTGLVWSVLWLVLCLPWLLGVWTIPFDAVQQFFPAVSFTAQQLLLGDVPWWNPYLHGGYPQLADPQMMTLQPTVVLPMLLAPTSLHWFTVVILLHVLVAGMGALKLAAIQGLQRLPQLMFALVFLFGGVAAARLQHTPMIVSYCLLPWLWLALDQLRRHLHWRHAVLAGVVGGLCALQLTQVTYLIVLACAVFSIAAVLMAPTRRMRLCLQLAAVGAIAAAVSAPQWLSTFAWLAQTNRDGVSLQAALPGAIHWQSLVTLLSGNVFEQGRGDSWAFGDITTDYLYMGAVPLAVWLAWGGAVVRSDPRGARIALAVFVLAVLFALGGATPLFPWLFGWLPGLDLFRRPSDGLFLAVPAAAWLSAHALQSALQRDPLRPHLPSLLVVAVLAVAGVWLVVDSGRLQGSAWLAISVAIGAVAVRQLIRHRSPSRWLLGLMLLDLLMFNVSTSFNARSATRPVLTATRPGPAQSAYRLLSAQRSDGLPVRALAFGVGPLTNGAAVYGLALANGYNPLLDRRALQMLGMPGDPLDSVQQKPETPWTPDFDAPLYDLIGVRWVLAPTAFPGSHAYDAELQVMQRDSMLPRMLNPTAVHRHDEDLPPAAAFNRTDFSTTVWLPRDTQAACADAGAGTLQMGATVYRASGLSVQVDAAAPAWLVVNEVSAPGWQASVDGAATPLMRANGLFRAVCVPAGRHQVAFRFSPLQLWREGLGQRLGR